MGTMLGDADPDAAAPAGDPTPRRRADAAVAALLVLLAGAMHLPWIARPFGAMEINPASYFGVFALNWARHGFLELRGVPVGPFELDGLAQAQPYLTHPPGFMWLCALFGTDEWAIRLPAALGALASPVLLFLLLRRRLDPVAAGAGGAVLAVAPLLGFHATGSYEHAVLPLGLLAWLALLRAAETTGAWRRVWLGALLAASLVGPWMDWAYGFFCAALLPLAWSGRPRATVRRLAVPWLASAASLGLVAAWLAWASGTGALASDLSLSGVLERLGRARPAGPPLASAIPEAAARLVEGYGLPLLLAGLAGLVPFARSAPRLALAMAIAAAGNPVVLTGHSLGHVFFWAYAAPLAGGGVAALVAGSRALPQPARGMAWCVLAAALLWAAARTLEHRIDSQTTFFRAFGRALTEATRPEEPGAPPALVVHSHVELRYGYYVRSSLVWPHPLEDPAVLEQQRATAAPGYGIRYLLLRLEGSAADAAPGLAPPPRLVQWLERFPARPLPELVGEEVVVPGTGREARVAAARLFELR